MGKNIKSPESPGAAGDTNTPESSDSARAIDAIDRFYSQVTDTSLTHVPVSLSLILAHRLPDVALYLTSNEKGSSGFKIFRNRGLYLSQIEIDTLSRNGIKQVFIERADIPAMSQYLGQLLAEQPTNSPMVDEQKVSVLRKSAVQVMTDIFAEPSPQNIERGVKVVSQFVYMLMRDPKAYQLLLNLSSHDHYTLQHSVGCATNSIILAKKIGIDDEASLIEAGVGGLLHDVGKTKVPAAIINKKGPLDESEWAIMKQHSVFGHEIIKDNPNIGTRAKLAVLQHHEDANGSGYPLGLTGSQISPFAKIVTLADIYNALTTDRTYSKAKTPYDAFQLIKAKLAHKVDAHMFEAMVKIYGGKG